MGKAEDEILNELIASIDRKIASIKKIKQEKRRRIESEKKKPVMVLVQRVRKHDVGNIPETGDIGLNIMILGILVIQVFIVTIQQQTICCNCNNFGWFFTSLLLSMVGIFAFVWVHWSRIQDICKSLRNLKDQPAKSTVWLYYQLPMIVFGVIALLYAVVLVIITIVSCSKAN